MQQKPATPHPNFRRIRLELAREPRHPAGSRSVGYILFAPLDRDGKLDAALWRQHRQDCRVVRFAPEREDEIGKLVHRPGGSWAFHYDSDEETGFHLDKEHFQAGEYVSVLSRDGAHTYRVASVEKP